MTRRSAQRGLPMWARWALSLGVAIAALVLLVIFVRANNSSSEATVSTAAQVRANREAEVVVGQDQAPRTVALAPGADASVAMADGVRADIDGRIRQGSIDGTLTHVGCRRGKSHGSRLAYSCTAVAGDVNYPFVGVADARTHRLTFCKRDLPPVPSENIPVSKRCRL